MTTDGVWVVRFRVWGLGFGIRGFGFQIWSKRFGVYGLGFRVWAWGVMVNGNLIKRRRGRKHRRVSVVLVED